MHTLSEGKTLSCCTLFRDVTWMITLTIQSELFKSIKLTCYIYVFNKRYTLSVTLQLTLSNLSTCCRSSETSDSSLTEINSFCSGMEVVWPPGHPRAVPKLPTTSRTSKYTSRMHSQLRWKRGWIRIKILHNIINNKIIKSYIYLFVL